MWLCCILLDKRFDDTFEQMQPILFKMIDPTTIMHKSHLQVLMPKIMRSLNKDEDGWGWPDRRPRSDPCGCSHMWWTPVIQALPFHQTLFLPSPTVLMTLQSVLLPFVNHFWTIFALSPANIDVSVNHSHPSTTLLFPLARFPNWVDWAEEWQLEPCHCHQQM